MPEALAARRIACPYCGETITIVIDCSAGDQDTIEGCQVCCRPIAIGAMLDSDSEIVELTIKREDE